VVLGCMVAMVAVFVVLSVSQLAVLSLAFSALAGLAAGPVWAMLISFAAKEFPAYSATAVSIMAMGSGLGATVVPILVGWSAGSVSLHFSMLVVGGVMLLGSLAFVVYMGRKSR